MKPISIRILSGCLVAATALLFTACTESTSSSHGAGDSPVPGVWAQVCVAVDTTTYTNRVIALNNTDEYIMVNSSYDNANCSGAALSTQTILGSYYLGNEVNAADGTPALEVDMEEQIIDGSSVPLANRVTLFSILAVDSGQLVLGDTLSDPALDGSTAQNRSRLLLNSAYEYVSSNANAYYYSGVWSTPCEADAVTGGYKKMSYSFTVSSLTISDRSYSDSACATAPTTYLSSAKYKLEARALSAGATPAMGINAVYSQYNGNVLAPSNYLEQYNIIYRDGNRLYLGDLEADPLKDGSTPDKRPVELGADVFGR